MIMEGDKQTKRTFADFSIEAILRKDANKVSGDARPRFRGIVQPSNLFSSFATNSCVNFTECYDGYCHTISELVNDCGGSDTARKPEVEPESEEELISVSDENGETGNYSGCRKSENGPRNDEDSSDSTFEWLTCTRFKPPKLPRPRRKSTSRRHGRGPRIPFSTHQLAILESTFVNAQYLSSDAIARLAENLNLTETRVKIWFQNRRARFRREKESSSFLPEIGIGTTASSNFSVDSKRMNKTVAAHDHHLFSSPNESPPSKKTFRHLINDLNLMAANASGSISGNKKNGIFFNLDSYRIPGNEEHTQINI